MPLQKSGRWLEGWYHPLIPYRKLIARPRTGQPAELVVRETAVLLLLTNTALQPRVLLVKPGARNDFLYHSVPPVILCSALLRPRVPGVRGGQGDERAEHAPHCLRGEWTDPHANMTSIRRSSSRIPTATRRSASRPRWPYRASCHRGQSTPGVPLPQTR